MSDLLTNELTLENAKLFQQEAITPYEKVLARNLVAALQREDILRKALEEIIRIRDKKCGGTDTLEAGNVARRALKRCEYP